MSICRCQTGGVTIHEAQDIEFRSGERMITAFISYAKEDQAIAERLTADLRKRGLNIWFDQQEILVGDWRRTMYYCNMMGIGIKSGYG